MGAAEDHFRNVQKNGLAAIEQYVKTKEPENLFLDYKRSEGQQKAGKFSDRDKDNLSKAISGFGNTSGGVIVWGIKCKPGPNGVDVPTGRRPLKKVNEFRSKIEHAISSLTLPAHEAVQNHTVLVNDEGDGYLITWIPRSDHAPLRALRHDNYYWRSGESFRVVPHEVLAGMFGRYPVPSYELQVNHLPSRVGRGHIEMSSSLVFCNTGIVVCDEVYMSINVRSQFGSKSTFSISPLYQDKLLSIGNMPRHQSFVASQDYRIGPQAQVRIIDMHLHFETPFEEPLQVDFYFGCKGSGVNRLQLFVPQDIVEELYRDISSVNVDLVREAKGSHEADKILAEKVDIYRDRIFQFSPPLTHFRPCCDCTDVT